MFECRGDQGRARMNVHSTRKSGPRMYNFQQVLSGITKWIDSAQIKRKDRERRCPIFLSAAYGYLRKECCSIPSSGDMIGHQCASTSRFDIINHTIVAPNDRSDRAHLLVIDAEDTPDRPPMPTKKAWQCGESDARMMISETTP